MNDLVFGKYIPIDSLIHRLDPRGKIVALLIMVSSIFISDSWYNFLFIAILLSIEVLLAKLSIKFIISAFKPMIVMMIFLLIINVLTIKTGTIWLTLFSIEIYSDAIMNTLFVIVRLLLMIIITTSLTATTKPLDLTLGLESLMKPLELLHFPTHEVAMMISIALRFIPTIIEETMRIMNAQKSRGVDFEEGRLQEKINAILSLIIPLFSVAFERAYELADAMDARGYVPGEKRSRYHILKFCLRDYILIIVCLLALGFSIYTRIYL